MRRVRRRGGNKEKVFGCDLLEHLNTSCQEIPQVLKCCSEFVEHHGIVDGIYRLSGVSSNIQKLRGEFESDGTPDLNKDVYLQDIHCVSSLCKAYFRELPNPLLTYQLYDKFAEAVAIQLEEERLVKIRDVLKELPTPHYRTLEYLMRHLVRMASYSSETNMHARNLAIVWAPNLLRSKDIEATGFNGTAAFMEVRVQSIVVEFILTHVPQLFPDQDVSSERRNSLPSPSAEFSQDEAPLQPVHNFGNISPGDGPLAMRPYHAIIEGTDKRKGSLKGRKWMSIFNIGGRFPDPRRKHKSSSKDKDRTALRPARSMDSLSSPPYPKEGSRHSGQRPPSTHMTQPVTTAPQSGTDVTVSTNALSGSEYAVTYRRGTGLVSGGTGTQGTYTALDPEGLGISPNEVLQSRSPGVSTKAGRRAAMHITRPTMVTVPLHITSNLMLGVMQGGGSIVHRGRDKDGGDKVERKESREREANVKKEKKVEDEEKEEGSVEMEGNTVVTDGVGKHQSEEEEKEEKEEEEEEEEEEEKEENEEVVRDCRYEEKPGMEDVVVSGEERIKSFSSCTDDDVDEDAANVEQYDNYNNDYMVMKVVKPVDLEPAENQAEDASDVLNSNEGEGDNQEFFGYVEDNFDFLNQMDCSFMDHMDSNSSYQVNEFSVEPPGHSDDEYEVMSQVPFHHLPEVQTIPTLSSSPTEIKPHRPLSLDLHNRHTKSLSLPYMTSPVAGPEGFSSEEDELGMNSDDNESISDEDESMYIKSLPPNFHLRDRVRFEQDTQRSSEEIHHQTLHCKEEATTGDQEQMTNNEDEEALDKNRPEEHVQSLAAEEDVVQDVQSDRGKPLTSQVEFPLPHSEDTDAQSIMEIEEEKEKIDNLLSHTDLCSVQETGDVLFEESIKCFKVGAGDDEHSDEGQKEADTCQEMVLEIKESDKNILAEGEKIADKKDEEESQAAGKYQDSATHSCDIWEKLEDVVCEVIEDEESELAERDGYAGRDDEEEQKAEMSGDKIVEEDEEETNKAEVGVEVDQELVDTTKELTDLEMQQDFVDTETSELEEEIQETHAENEETWHRDTEEDLEKMRNDKERVDEQLTTLQSVDKQLQDARSDVKPHRCDEIDLSLRGVGRKLVVSKNPKVYQVKAVPVVPPKPQHCKITALTLRQQQQQRERREAERGRENLDTDRVSAAEQGGEGGGEWDRRRADGEDTSRNSPISMCFDEAVAKATMRREKEKECEKEKERQRDWGGEVQ